MHEWISPVSISLRDLEVPDLQAGRAMGKAVIAALDFTAGFTHMEWYRKADGEVVFGEIGARPAGARVADLMNFATDGDVYVAWAEAVVHGRLSQPLERRYNAGAIFKRAQGAGAITRSTGWRSCSPSTATRCVAGGPAAGRRAIGGTGARRSTSDGMVIVRHPELQRVIEMTERFAADLQMYAD